MPYQRVTGPRQCVSVDWSEIEVATKDTAVETVSRLVGRGRAGAGFVDLALEEYTGTTRRAKYTSPRLDTAAALALYDLLAVALSLPGVRGRSASPD